VGKQRAHEIESGTGRRKVAELKFFGQKVSLLERPAAKATTRTSRAGSSARKPQPVGAAASLVGGKNFGPWKVWRGVRQPARIVTGAGRAAKSDDWRGLGQLNQGACCSGRWHECAIRVWASSPAKIVGRVLQSSRCRFAESAWIVNGPNDRVGVEQQPHCLHRDVGHRILSQFPDVLDSRETDACYFTLTAE
jgi:hypothetical protein